MTYTVYCPTRMIFSDDAAADLAREIETLPPGRLVVISDEGILRTGLAEPLIEALNKAGREARVFSQVPSNPGVADVTAAVHAAAEAQAVAVVAVGGGSPMDVAKAVGLLLAHGSHDWEPFQWNKVPVTQGSRPVIAIPTTAGTGSEVTHVAVIGDAAGFKKGLVHTALFARAAIIDGGLMRGLPPALTAATGMDALTHAIEAYLAKRHNPSMDLLALGAMRAIVAWLPEATRSGNDLAARRAMAQAAVWAGEAMDQAGLGLCHALCGPVTTYHHLHHGLANAALLPAVLAYNAPAISAERWPAMRAALGLPPDAAPGDLPGWMRQFVAGLGLPDSLAAAGVDRAHLEAMAAEATRMAMINNNVRPAGAEECRAVLDAALVSEQG